MTPITPDPLLGVALHSVGALSSANCYAPQKFIRRWSWQTFWLTQAAWCWFLWPIIIAVVTIPHLAGVLAEAWQKCPGWVVGAVVCGITYGVGGTAFNISIRYIGFSLTYAIAVGLSSILGTIVPPLVRGEVGSILGKAGSSWVVLGLVAGAAGIAVCGAAGRFKERDLAEQAGGPGQFSLAKGLLLSILAGVLSAVYGIGIDLAAGPVIKIAAVHGAGHWKGNIAYLLVNPGTFLTAAAYSLWLARRHRTLGELTRLAEGPEHASLWGNYALAFLTGTLWYGQFFFYNLGHVRMGRYEFSSWGIHMIMLVLLSNLTAVLFREWKGCRERTQAVIALGLTILVAAVVSLSYGNYLGEKERIAAEHRTIAREAGEMAGVFSVWGGGAPSPHLGAASTIHAQEHWLATYEGPAVE